MDVKTTLCGLRSIIATHLAGLHDSIERNEVSREDVKRVLSEHNAELKTQAEAVLVKLRAIEEDLDKALSLQQDIEGLRRQVGPALGKWKSLLENAVKQKREALSHIQPKELHTRYQQARGELLHILYQYELTLLHDCPPPPPLDDELTTIQLIIQTKLPPTSHIWDTTTTTTTGTTGTTTTLPTPPPQTATTPPPPSTSLSSQKGPSTTIEPPSGVKSTPIPAPPPSTSPALLPPPPPPPPSQSSKAAGGRKKSAGKVSTVVPLDEVKAVKGVKGKRKVESSGGGQDMAKFLKELKVEND